MADHLDLSSLIVSIQQISQIIGLNGKTLTTIADNITALNNVPPVGVNNFLTGTAVSATTGTLIAPSNGAAIIICTADSSVIQGVGGALTSSLSGLLVVADTGAGSINRKIAAYLPMSIGQASTFTGSFTVGSSAYLGLFIFVFFLPLV